MSAPAFIPVSAAVGSVAALRISFFQISGRIGEATVASRPAVVERLRESLGAAASAVRERADGGRADTRVRDATELEDRSAVVGDADDDLLGWEDAGEDVAVAPAVLERGDDRARSPTSGRAASAAEAVW